MVKTFSAPDLLYFEALTAYSRDFVARFGTHDGLMPLDRILGELKPALESRAADEEASIDAIPWTTADRRPDPKTAIGLNTAGLLADRLTILVIKEGRLRRSGLDKEGLRIVSDVEIPDICRALAQARPAEGSLVGKVTTIRTGIEATSWAAAYYGLLSANLLLWEAQEILYMRDILSLPSEELRAYIRWFSTGNMMRNEFIALCDRLLWKAS